MSGWEGRGIEGGMFREVRVGNLEVNVIVVNGVGRRDFVGKIF